MESVNRQLQVIEYQQNIPPEALEVRERRRKKIILAISHRECMPYGTLNPITAFNVSSVWQCPIEMAARFWDPWGGKGEGRGGEEEGRKEGEERGEKKGKDLKIFFTTTGMQLGS